jgi:Zn-finger nucleic acid-binding protein
VGSRVRCQCDEVIEVGTQKSMQVRALHCSHCGGAVEAEEPNCRWCGAKLTEKDRLRSTLCPMCYTRIGDDARHCKSCGVAIAPQALTPLPEDDACPRCEGGLLIRALGVVDVVECGDCGGMWLTARVYEAVCRDAERKLDTFLLAEPKSATPPPEPPGRKYIPCLTCRQLMLRKNFRYGTRGSGIVVDYCRGHGVWLDRDELEHVVQHVKRTGGAQPAGEGIGTYLDRPLRTAPTRTAGLSGSSRQTSGWLSAGLSELLLAIGFPFFE